MIFYIAVSSICFISGVLNGMAGFGALIIMVPLLLLFMGLDVIVPLSVLCGIAPQALMVIIFRQYLRKDSLSRLFIGSLPGIWVGSSVLLYMPESLLRAVLGVLVICYVLWSVFGGLSPKNRNPSPLWAYAAGFFSGAFGGAFGINGPPAVIYATRTTWSPKEIRAFLGAFCGVLFAATALIMAIRNLITPEVWSLALLAAPFTLIGSYCGLRLTTHIQTKYYTKLIFMLLFILGCSLCWPALKLLYVLISGVALN